WVKKAEKLLQGDSFGPLWTQLVAQWRLREEQTGFETSTKSHSAKLRPAQVGAWVQRARAGAPDIKDTAVFAKEFKAWWQDINPAWRKISLPMPRKGGPWTFMQVPGQNGFLNVLMCLKWWTEKISDESEDWKDAVEDIMWVLEQMNG
ncbi:hypothetical protein B0H14DRAFT_2375614, partial [Mycena olivaceomarginata]